jgi:ABC-type uncharacterized transport system permease subunit
VEALADALFYATSAAYVTATVVFLRFLAQGKGDIGTTGPRLIAFGAVAHALHIVVASKVAHVCPVAGIRFPMSVAAMVMCVAYVALRRRLKIAVAGAFIAPLALTTLLASRFVGGSMEPGQKIQSAVLPFHVTTNLVGVALFSLAFAAALLYLVQERRLKQK